MDEQRPTRPEQSEAERRREERELVTGGHPLVDDAVLEQPTDDREHDEGAGRREPTPNPDQIAP